MKILKVILQLLIHPHQGQVNKMEQIFDLTDEVIVLVNKKERFRATLNGLKKHTETESKCDEIELDLEVIGLPQHRLIAVRDVEPITIFIGEGDFMPSVKVRNDFPPVPHLNILEDNITKTLCYSDLHYEEIKHKMSGRFLLTCIENWFLKTSLNELHRPDQPMEPFFPYANDVIIWDGYVNNSGFEKYIVEEREFGNLMYRCSEGTYYAVLNLPVHQDYSNLIHNMPQTLFDLLYSFDNEVTIKTWLNIITKIIRDVKKYNQYFGQIKAKFLNCKVIINIAILKSRTADDLPESYDFRTFVSEKTLKDILIDYGLVLNGSKIKDSAKSGSNGKKIPIKLFNVHFQCSKIQNKLLNSIKEQYGNEKIALIGVGAIGSHILNNFLREGYGKWTIIDNDYFWPHNIARHILTSKDVGYMKAKALASLSTLIQNDTDIEAVTEDLFSRSDLICNSLQQVDVILDASASVAVERLLALDIETCARRLSCFLNPRGTATIMLLESSDGKARLDLLEMQYYRELVSNVKFKDHMKLPETKVYSGTCRSITSRISQDDVSLSASLCSKAFKIHLKDKTGKIIIWTHRDDSVSKDIFFADSWHIYKYDKWTIEISNLLLNDIINDRTKHMPNETGGVLIGAFDLSRKRIYIVYQVKAPEDSISSPYSFIRGCKNLPQKLEFIYKTTLGNLFYIGEWHSHPNDNTQKSADDEKLHHAITEYNRENCVPGCMMIVGSKNYSIYINE